MFIVAIGYDVNIPGLKELVKDRENLFHRNELADVSGKEFSNEITLKVCQYAGMIFRFVRKMHLSVLFSKSIPITHLPRAKSYRQRLLFSVLTHFIKSYEVKKKSVI